MMGTLSGRRWLVSIRFVDGMALKRLTYAALIAKPEGN
jgi:hypothetical protein